MHFNDNRAVVISNERFCLRIGEAIYLFRIIEHDFIIKKIVILSFLIEKIIYIRLNFNTFICKIKKIRNKKHFSQISIIF